MTTVEPPLALLAELTHRCPLRCPYCSNPTALAAPRQELDTVSWEGVLRQAAALGVLQVHFSGGEPLARRDLTALVDCARDAGLYSNLITSGLGLTETRLQSLLDAGLDHIQLSIQDADPDAADAIAGRPAFRQKRDAAALIRATDLPLTVNFVLHRHNIGRLEAMIDLAVALGAQRIEAAHVQYHGWALRNRAALMPTETQIAAADRAIETARARLGHSVAIDYVASDHFAVRPKACMDGWARRFLVISPTGTALPCHAAEGLPGLSFPRVTDLPLDAIWRESPAFARFRGTEWMPAPCQGCVHREEDWGGCRCQAFALTGDPGRTDPACALSPDRPALDRARDAALRDEGGRPTYRGD